MNTMAFTMKESAEGSSGPGISTPSNPGFSSSHHHSTFLSRNLSPKESVRYVTLTTNMHMPRFPTPQTNSPSRWMNYTTNRLEIDITAYGPFQTKYAAVLGAKLALLDCINCGSHPDPPPLPPANRIGFYIELQGPRLHPMQLYQEIVSRLSLILDDSMHCGTVELENWAGCRMVLSHEFPDL